MGGVRTYRTRLPLRIAVAAAAVLWGAVFGLFARVPGSEPTIVAGAAAFAVFFAGCFIVYGRTSITVTSEGIVATSAFRRRPVRFDDILEILVRDGLGGRFYAVVTRRGLVHFTSLFARHRELFETLLERAGLRPLTT